jgi:drug/metabolite transporter, DME family
MTGRPRVLLAALLFSTGGAAIKACALTSWQVASLRSGVAAVTLLLLLPAARRRWRPRTLAVAAAYAATMILYVLANKLTTAANTIFLQSSAPLYVVLLAPRLLGEPLRARDLAFMAVLGGGVLLFFVGAPPAFATAPDPGRGDQLAVLSGVTWALTIMGLRWMAAADDRTSATVGSALVCGNLLACLVCLPMALPLVHAAPADWLVVGYLGTCQIGLAYLFLAGGVRLVPALEASLLLLIEPVLNALWAWIVQGEAPGTWPLVGGAIILGATGVRTWREAGRARSA